MFVYTTGPYAFAVNKRLVDPPSKDLFEGHLSIYYAFMSGKHTVYVKETDEEFFTHTYRNLVLFTTFDINFDKLISEVENNFDALRVLYTFKENLSKVKRSPIFKISV